MDKEEENSSGDQCPGNDTETRHHLYSKLLAAGARVVDVGIPGILNVDIRAESARGKDTPHPSKSVHNACVARVIDLHLEHEEVEDKIDGAAYRTNHNRMPRLYDCASCCDGYETCVCAHERECM